MSDTDWIAALRPGDDVIVDYRSGEMLTLGRVVRRTPTGRIIVRYSGSDSEFNPNGDKRSVSRYDYVNLREPTQAMRDEIERRRLARKLEAVEWNKLPLETL